MPAVLLLVVSFLTSDHSGNLFWLGAVIQVLVFCYLISNKRAWHQPLGTLALVAYLIAVAWLWIAGAPDHWFVHLAQFVLLAVPLTLFAIQTLQDSGAFASRRAHQLVQRLLQKKDWPTELEECRALPDVKALREALVFDASPALTLLAHRMPQMRMAALSALEFRKQWWPGQPEVVLRYAQKEADPALRAEALMALANIEDRSLIEIVGEFLRDPDREVRRAAADALFWDIDRRWSWLRTQVRYALSESERDGPLRYNGPPLPPDAVSDLLAWSTEKGVLGARAALTLGEHYSRRMTHHPESELIRTLKQRLASVTTPATLRIELAQLLKSNNELDRDLQEKLLDPGNPASLRLMAADLLLAAESNPKAVLALRDIARMPNREMALTAADIVQRRLSIDMGLPIGQPLPALHSRQAADVTRKLMKWAEELESTPVPNEETKLDSTPGGTTPGGKTSSGVRKKGSGAYGLPAG